MVRGKREITKDLYDRSMENNGHLKTEWYSECFTTAERLGYGVYGTLVFEEDGKYYVQFSMGESCD